MTTIQTPYTSGPWHVANGSVYVSRPPAGVSGICIAHMDRDEPATRPTERDANARLIAKAPEMAATIRTFVGMLERDGFTGPVLNDARALLARIDGQERG